MLTLFQKNKMMFKMYIFQKTARSSELLMHVKFTSFVQGGQFFYKKYDQFAIIWMQSG